MAATGADWPPVGSGFHFDLDGQFAAFLQHSEFSVHKGLVMLDPIEDSFQ
jgi:hypothetical protein